jgi:sortase (surface protein transpeptidase)
MNLLPPHFVRDLKKLQKKQKRILAATKLFTVLGAVFLVLSFAPSVWYGLAVKVDDYSLAILETASMNNKEEDKPTVQIPEWQPVFNQKLSRETIIKIPEINLETTVNERTYQNYEDALRLGVWRVPDFGTPADRKKPVILAAHRFGYLEWSNLYRRKNSFFNLPKLKNGDLVEITYKQRKYVYEIYDESRGEEIKDYGANLILYTCETLNSKIRIFKYARLLQI